jgi:rare lipoprotein A
VGNQTASGEFLDAVTATAAHRSLPPDSFAKVTNLDNGRSVIVKINDRGPYTRGRILEVKGLTLMVNNIYNGQRFEDLWLDE